VRTFRCACGARLFYENSRCLTCSRELGFLPDRLTLSAIELDAGGMSYHPVPAVGTYRKCQNYVEHGVCNWMIPADDASPLCLACRLNNVIPDLSNPDSYALWAEVETAKRRLLYSLLRLRLPIVPKVEDAVNGLAFDIKAELGAERVLTGHDEGLITLNLAEADPVQREKIRVAMNERYRTLLGHFRHEIGHYYWERLINGTERLEPFRALFGNEQADYSQALQRHYEAGPPPGFAESFITSYAAAHPWEDWAETFAHYLHVLDTLETAHHFGFTADVPRNVSPLDVADFDLLLREWLDLTVALNALNRSMGVPDAYPFAITPAVRAKLAFVHECVTAGAQAATPGPRAATAPPAGVTTAPASSDASAAINR
jgi:hypothetical protein